MLCHDKMMMICPGKGFPDICSKDVRLPVQLQRAMAAEAEAAREARAKVSQTERGFSLRRSLKWTCRLYSILTTLLLRPHTLSIIF